MWVTSLDAGMANCSVPDAEVLSFATPIFAGRRSEDVVGAEPEMANKLVRVNRPG